MPAYRFFWDQEQVTVVLSGMNSDAMVRDNMATASDTRPGEMTEADRKMLAQVVAAINEGTKVGCTGCGYCQPCPKGVDIPGTFAAWNRRYSEGKLWGLVDYFICTTLRPNACAASNCVDCGKCEQHCPQGIPIRQKLKEARKELETPVYRFACKVARLFRF